MKTIAMYLPQFHRVPENDEWWGEGFTEWTTVKAGEKLFDTHNQVREPLNDNYYDLLKKETMQWQADLAAVYGVDGFCFYHYYFKDGRKILEKPAENLLQWKDIHMPFCFCWANETWARTWSNLTFSNAWSEKFEKRDSQQRSVLLEQAYGDETEWQEHLNYLLPFFEDERYMKVEGKVLFLFYRPEDIVCLSEMIGFWNRELQKTGHAGIYAMGVNSSGKTDGLDAVLAQGPIAYRNPKTLGLSVEPVWKESVATYDYNLIYENALRANAISDVKTYFGGFVDYDDTPRRGAAGNCLEKVSAEKFEEYIYKLYVKNAVLKNDILFINAWNEWGEGNYMEPDKKNGFAFLEALKRAKNRYEGIAGREKNEWDIISREIDINVTKSGNDGTIKELNKYISFFRILDRWLLLKEKNVGIEEYFKHKHFERIVIYGFSTLGKHLFEELCNCSVQIVGVMDRRKDIGGSTIEIIGPNEPVPECDVVVMTPVNDIAQVSEELRKRTDSKLVTLQEVIFYQYDEIEEKG